jgi:hypothetical protein
VQILCTFVTGKMLTVETIPGMEGRGDKREWWRGWIQVWYSWYIVRTFVNATMCSSQRNNKKI